DLKPYILLGSSVEIALGYSGSAASVFSGYISRVNFIYEDGGAPGVRITAMDVKGAMMASNYSKQIYAKSYGEAVQQILQNGPYQSMTNAEVIRSINVSDTPDKEVGGVDSAGMGGPDNKASDRTIEMVAESDYEFVVKAAKKYNFEFFTDCGHVYFRPAKNDPEVLMEMGPGDGLRFFDVEYDITGQVETVKARSINVGKAKLIEAKEKINNKLSIGNKAKRFIKKTEKVYLDATITSQEEADYRVKSLVEEISYRFGTLECECVGIPELRPGKFFELKFMGDPPENRFYLHRVVHKMSETVGFTTKLYGKSASITKEETVGIGGITGGLI
ncbi:MAG: hypothetical protein Q4C06_08065, partial [Bacillota bacterium]|nr:hypothetical protein [Bacillota bacterium]